jgi:hypothetical protein
MEHGDLLCPRVDEAVLEHTVALINRLFLAAILRGRPARQYLDDQVGHDSKEPPRFGRRCRRPTLVGDEGVVRFDRVPTRQLTVRVDSKIRSCMDYILDR